MIFYLLLGFLGYLLLIVWGLTDDGKWRTLGDALVDVFAVPFILFFFVFPYLLWHNCRSLLVWIGKKLVSLE